MNDRSAPHRGPWPKLTLELLRGVIRRSPFSSWVDAQAVACGDGKAELSVKWRPEFAQHHGFLHGALVGYIADSACAWAAASVVGDVLTAQYDLRLLAPGVGDHFIGRAEVVKTTRRQVVAQAKVFAVKDGQEKLIAIAMATILPAGEAAGTPRAEPPA